MDASIESWQVAGRGVPVSHLDAPYWPEDGITKRALLTYYERMAPLLLPYCRDRPATLRVFPEGVRGASYYRRDRPGDAPAWLRSTTYQPRRAGDPVHLLLIDDAAGLVWLANQGAIEFHLWSARLPALDRPDLAIFDLDPGDRATFADVLRAALLLREALERLGLRGHAKTSGGRGLHVYLPLAPGQTYPAVRGWIKSLAQRLAATQPALLAVAGGATHRGGHVTIDYAQNSVGRNTAAPYTVRAVQHARVSAPVSWAEVASGTLRPADFTMHTMARRLEAVGDLFAPVLRADQTLPDPEP